MIARLANDDTQELLSADIENARDSLAASVDQLISAARSRSWHERGRSQVVFNGPPANADASISHAPGDVSN
jgi:hypothetical protein